TYANVGPRASWQSHQGPGGLAEAVSMTLALWMLTVPFLLIQSGAAALAGGAIVSLAMWISSKAGYHPLR
ncbi:hypothetical protein, partial [Solirhodobacter olei]|uniref:hypothetical protein n=1 Tax=Solirhodobacter olei TaxID=2493082 RepID=UPI0019D4C73A